MFETLVTQPLYNVLIAAFDLIPPHDFGIAIIVATLFIKLILLHVSKKQIESQRKIQKIQPEIKALQKKYKEDKEKLAKETMALYKKTGTNPFAGCLPLILQAVFFIAFYHIVYNISTTEGAVDAGLLYSFVANPGTVSLTLLGILSLAAPSPILAVITAAAQYFQMKAIMPQMAAKKDADTNTDDAPNVQDFAESMSKQMLYIIPGMMLVFGFMFPGGVTLYWLTSTLFSIVQQRYIIKRTDDTETTPETPEQIDAPKKKKFSTKKKKN